MRSGSTIVKQLRLDLDDGNPTAPKKVPNSGGFE